MPLRDAPFTAAVGGLSEAVRLIRHGTAVYGRTRLDHDATCDVMVTSAGDAELRCTRSGSWPWAYWSAEVHVPCRRSDGSEGVIHGVNHRSLAEAVFTAGQALRYALARELLYHTHSHHAGLRNPPYKHDDMAKALAKVPPLRASLRGFADDLGIHCTDLEVILDQPDGLIEARLSSANDPDVARRQSQDPLGALLDRLEAVSEHHTALMRAGSAQPLRREEPFDPHWRDVDDDLCEYSPRVGGYLAAWAPVEHPHRSYSLGPPDDPCGRSHGAGAIALLERVGTERLEAARCYSADIEPQLFRCVQRLEALPPASPALSL